MLLSDMGAEVVKIEPPDGDPWRIVAGGFMACNRGKRSIAVDLKKPEAREIIHKLITLSDIMVENARWGVWHRLGLDYESVVKIKPDIIYVSVLGHGSKGPYSTWPAYDPLLQCRSGQMVTQGGIGKPPVFHGIPINDQAGPMLAAYGALLALFVHAKTGKGQHVETSLTNASVAMQAGDFIDYPEIKRKYLGDTDIKGLNATYRHYQAGDGRWLFVLCPREEHWRSLCKVMDLEMLLYDPRFKTPEKREANDSALVKILSASFKGKPAVEWIEALRQADVPVALGQTVEEVLRDPHCLQTNVFDDRNHPQYGQVRLLGVGPRFSEISGIIRRPVPLLGQHTEEVLMELGYSKKQITKLKTKRIVYSTPESD
jgi:formyl-CoA transferase